MATIKKLLENKPDKKIILQGNVAFALGVLHAGYHAADGYPGTPSTEILEHLIQVPDMIIAEWSVNEAVAVGVGVGHAIAGHDTIITMKVPGLFQAADVVSSASFSDCFSGALVIFVATDHAPSSTQYIVDTRYFLSSLYLPIIEPRNHQDLYLSAFRAADLSRKHSTPVVILCSSVLCHSEGIITPIQKRYVAAASFKNSTSKVLLPKDARKSFNHAINKKMPEIHKSIETGGLVTAAPGMENWGIIACGEAALIVQEVLDYHNVIPHQLFMGITNPLPLSVIKKWSQGFDGPIFVVEDGERFVESKLTQEGIKVTGKENFETITHWTPDLLSNLLSSFHLIKKYNAEKICDDLMFSRFPSICPGCPYKAISLVIQKLKKQNKIDIVFGDIGCSTLLHFQKALDINLCMGASESMRQGYVRAKPQSAHRVISIIGDSSECHSGLDATRNAVFRNTPGVKIILDNGAIAMTGGQRTPTKANSSGLKRCNLDKVLNAEGVESITVDAYNYNQIIKTLENALKKAEGGSFTSIIVNGECIQTNKDVSKKDSTLAFDSKKCTQCGICSFCPAIDFTSSTFPSINRLCTRCGKGNELCVQLCQASALRVTKIHYQIHDCEVITKNSLRDFKILPKKTTVDLPESLRILICGVGGQGNLFMGKVLTNLMQLTPYIDKNIIKGETHGMAQKGGSVNSTFACGNVYSPIFSSQSVDILIAMEQNEALRPQYLYLLKPNATVLLHSYSIPPDGAQSKILLTMEDIMQQLCSFNVIICEAHRISPKNSNVAILGMLSCIPPFSNIPTENWIHVLVNLSNDFSMTNMNLDAFEAGRLKMASNLSALKNRS